MDTNVPLDLDHLSQQLARKLADCRCRVVFAESCTAGLVAATLAKIPGISDWLCGSAVTYRESAKSQWLGVSRHDLAEFSAVSHQVAEQMARGVLQRTDEADLAASVTGYLGPSSPDGMDGLVFVGLCRRSCGDSPFSVHSKRYQLTQPERTARQREATALVLQTVLQNA